MRTAATGPRRSSRASALVRCALAAAAVVGAMIASTASPAWSGQAAARARFKVVVFDYLVLFNANSLVPDAERVFPGKGRELTTLWRKEDVLPDARSAGAHIASRRTDVTSGFRRTPTTSK